ncbi:MAG: 2Fe-2S iron-sulfur cluster-binding protein, partial [Sedimentisphaerales bacterium]
MKHFNVTFRPDGRQVSIHAGATLIEAAGQAGIILNSICGGKGTCRKCLVSIGPDAEQVRACHYRIQSDVTVTIPQQSRFFEQKILAYGIEAEPIGPPDIFKKYIKIA